MDSFAELQCSLHKNILMHVHSNADDAAEEYQLLRSEEESMAEDSKCRDTKQADSFPRLRKGGSFVATTPHQISTPTFALVLTLFLTLCCRAFAGVRLEGVRRVVTFREELLLDHTQISKQVLLPSRVIQDSCACMHASSTCMHTHICTHK